MGKKIIDPFISSEQGDIEEKIDQIVCKVYRKEIYYKKASEIIYNIITDAMNKSIFSKEDQEDLDYRCDPDDPRSYLRFFLDIKIFQAEEHKTFLKFIKRIRKDHHNVKWESFGSDINGKVIIANFKTRFYQAAEPDYLIVVDNKKYYIEIKNFKNDQIFKISNLKRYLKKDTHMIIKCNQLGVNKVFEYGPQSMKYLLKNKKNNTKWGKNVIRVGINNSDKDIIFDELLDKKLVKEIKL